jgi:hypothetical protein
VLTKYPLVANNHSQHKDILYPQVTSCAIPPAVSVVVNMYAQLRLTFNTVNVQVSLCAVRSIHQ